MKRTVCKEGFTNQTRGTKATFPSIGEFSRKFEIRADLTEAAHRRSENEKRIGAE